MRFFLITGFLLTLVFSCSKDDTEIKTSGEVVLSSQILGSDVGYVLGFSFEKAEKISYNLKSTIIPDFVVENNIDLQGNTIGANLSSPKNDKAFYLAGEFDDPSASATFYEELTEVPSVNFSAKANEIKIGQVYVFQTRENNYAKFRITNLEIKKYASPQYIEVTIQWKYQPDGSTLF